MGYAQQLGELGDVVGDVGELGRAVAAQMRADEAHTDDDDDAGVGDGAQLVVGEVAGVVGQRTCVGVAGHSAFSNGVRVDLSG